MKDLRLPHLLSSPVLLIPLSYIIVAFGQPAWMGNLGLAAAVCGFALFWKAALSLPGKRQIFLLATAWFALVQIVQLSWMTAHEYVGSVIFFVYFLLCFGMGIQFALLTCMLPRERALSLPRMFAMAGFWVVMEWLRLFFLCGFTWNPLGLAWTHSLYASQLVSLFGVYGLSFCVVFVNLLALRCMQSEKKAKPFAIFVAAALTPATLGILHVCVVHTFYESKQPGFVNVLLVQTGLLPEQKLLQEGTKREQFLSPTLQWTRIIELASGYMGQPVDLIVLPEAAVPFGVTQPVSRWDELQEVFEKNFGLLAKKSLPPLQAPLAKSMKLDDYPPFWGVGNGYWAQSLSNVFQAEVVLGLEDFEPGAAPQDLTSYQAAFHFLPFDYGLRRYEKQVLVPMAEYLPFDWCRTMAERKGMYYFYTHGLGGKIFNGKLPMGLAICYEETFGNLMRKTRVLGAEILVNLSNDIWYPDSRLPWQHFSLGRLRAIENGIPLVRACNNGITGAVDSLGRVVGILEERLEVGTLFADSLYVAVPRFHYPTLYSRLGDALILFISLFCLLAGILLEKTRFFRFR